MEKLIPLIMLQAPSLVVVSHLDADFTEFERKFFLLEFHGLCL